MENMLKFFMVMLFGKKSMEGYYKTSVKEELEEDYVFASVFPNREAMEAIIGREDF